MNRSVLSFFIFLFFTASFVYGQGEYPKKITSVEGITEYHLENGLKVLLFPDQSKQTITVNITYLVGSRHEGYGETGMAHLLEHMVFKGTPDHPDIPKELSDHGARPNGTTFFDRTNYYETFAATDENLNWALDLEADRMINSYIAAEDLESEMTVVRNEYESGENDPTSVLYKRILSAAYTWHNYGNVTIGARADIENVPIDRLQAFYHKYYQPDNAVLTVAGKIDEAETLKLVDKYFSSIPKPDRKLIPTYTEEPTQDGERIVNLRRAGDIQSVACLYHIPSGLHPDADALAVLVQALTTQPSGRIYKRLVETQKATNAFAVNFALREPGFAVFLANVLKENDLEETKAILVNILDSLRYDPIPAEEVERTKAELLKYVELSLSNTENVGLELSEYIAMGDWRMMFISRDRIEAVTAEDVARVAEFYFKPSNRTLGTFVPEDAPERVEVPKSPSIERLVDGYKGRKVMDQGEAFDPTPENIENRSNKGTLASGLQYTLLAKETKGNIVTAQIGLRFGNEKTLFGKQIVASLAPALLDKGTSTMTRQDIKDFFDQRKASVNFSGGQGRCFVRIQTTRENLEEVLEKVIEILKDPVFPETEFETLVNQRIASIEESKSEPFSKANQVLSRHMSDYPKGHIFYVATPEEQIESYKAVKLEDVKAFYKEYFGAGSSSSSTVVGEFEEDNIKKILEEGLGDWKTKFPYDRPVSKVFTGKPINEEIGTPDKANAVFFALQEIPMKDSDPDYPALYVGNYLLGGGFLNSRLATRIRQKEGLSYGVGSFFSADGKDESATFGAQAIYNPDNKEALEKAFFEELQKVIDEGFTQEELDAAKKGLLQQSTVTRAQDASLLLILNNNMFYNRDMSYYSDFDKKIENLTLAQVNAAFKKYIKPDQLNVAKAGDFKNKVDKP